MSWRVARAALCVAVLLATAAQGQFKTVFVTSETTDGSITEGIHSGIEAADAICNRLAEAAGLDFDNGDYAAWLSDSMQSPSTSFVQATVPYRLPDGTTEVASSYADLLTLPLGTPINQDEWGHLAPPALVWTGTTASGNVTPDGHCDNWTVGDPPPALFAGAGGVGTADVGWTDAFLPFHCSEEYRLYCFQQGSVPVELLSLRID